MITAAGITTHIRPIGAGGAPEAPQLAAEEVGSKAANLQRLATMGLRVPSAFAVTTGGCRAYLAAGQRLPRGLADELRAALSHLETSTGRRLGGRHPLLVSVRSSPPVSMPGMLDT